MAKNTKKKVTLEKTKETPKKIRFSGDKDGVDVTLYVSKSHDWAGEETLEASVSVPGE